MTPEILESLSQKIQHIFRENPVLLVGSGFSCGYDLPGMRALAEHLVKNVGEKLTTKDAKNTWDQSIEAIRTNLEEGLNLIPMGKTEWNEIISIVRAETAKLILEKTVAAEKDIINRKSLETPAPARLLRRLFNGSPQNSDSIHVITTNYDTLLELFCDIAELPLDTGFTGFRRRKPRSQPIFQTKYERVLAPTKGRQNFEYVRCKTVRLYKPHGSISWCKTDKGPIEVLNDISTVERAIVAPGPSKYQDAMINMVFDAMRNEMNNVIEKKVGALFCVGFGFNDKHLQGALESRLAAKMPAIILTRDPTQNIEQLLSKHPHVIAIFKNENGDGAVCRWDGKSLQSPEPLWQLDDFLKKFVE